MNCETCSGTILRNGWDELKCVMCSREHGLVLRTLDAAELKGLSLDAHVNGMRKAVRTRKDAKASGW